MTNNPRPYQSQAVQARALGDSLYVLDRMARLTSDEVEEAVVAYMLAAGIQSYRVAFYQTTWRRLETLRQQPRQKTWGERRKEEEE